MTFFYSTDLKLRSCGRRRRQRRLDLDAHHQDVVQLLRLRARQVGQAGQAEALPAAPDGGN